MFSNLNLRFYNFFMLNSTDHEISMHIQAKILKKIFPALKHTDVEFILLISVKMPTIVGIFTFMSRINFMLS